MIQKQQKSSSEEEKIVPKKKTGFLQWFFKNLDTSTRQKEGNKSMGCCAAKH
jgi:hypothetical protein